MSKNTVFDDEFISELPEINSFHNPSVVCVCRLTHLFRDRLEEWFTHLPQSEQADMKSRLRSKDDYQHTAAMYELYLHEYCRERGWNVQKNPNVAGKTPDFLVSAGNTQFYLEVAATFESAGILRAKARMNAFLDKLNSIQSQFDFIVRLKSWPTHDIKPARIANQFRHLIRGLPQKKTTIDLSAIGLNGSILLMPSPSSSTGRIIQFTSPVDVGLPGIGSIENAIKQKSNKYKSLGLPLVIALCSTDLCPFNEISVQVKFYELVSPKGQGEKAVHTKVSAVLFCESERIDDDIKFKKKLFRNPWSAFPLDSCVFEGVTRYDSPSI